MRIAIVDKFPLIRFGLRLVLEKLGDDFIFTEEDSIRSFLSNRTEGPWGLIVIGLSQDYPVHSTRLIADARRANPGAKILICDDKPTRALVTYCMNAGCYGYISKQVDQPEMARCMEDVLAGKKAVSRDVIDMMFTQEVENQGRFVIPEPFRLTENEFKIASFLSEGKATGWIAGELERKASTVSTIKAIIFKKLQIDNIMELRERLGEVSVKRVRPATGSAAADRELNNSLFKKHGKRSMN